LRKFVKLYGIALGRVGKTSTQWQKCVSRWYSGY